MKTYLSLIILFHLLIGIYAFTNFTIEDVAIHASLTKIVSKNIYPFDYLPLSDTKFTYPILFYLNSSPFLIFVSINAVRIVGLFAFLLFPICIYLIGTLFNKRVALISMLFSVLISNFTILMIFSAFPQILAFDFYLLFVYFYLREKHNYSGIFLGLTILTHPFVAFLSFVSLIVFVFIYKDRKIIKTATIAFLISLIWIYQYFLIFIHAITGTWNNVRHYGNAGLITINDGISYVLRLNPAFIILAIISFFIMFKERDKKTLYFCALFLISFVFSIYRLAPAQLKFLDALTIGADFVIRKLDSKLFNVIFSFLILVSAIFPILTVYDYNSKYSAIDKKEIDAAKWLKEYDKTESMIVFMGEQKTETVFAAIANKIPLGGIISDLEGYTDHYKEQLREREKIIRGDLSLLEKYGVKYIVGECNLNVIYSDDLIRICKI